MVGLACLLVLFVIVFVVLALAWGLEPDFEWWRPWVPTPAPAAPGTS